MDYSQEFSTRETPQNEPIPGKSQIANSAGGYSFAVDDWKRLERFLILGSEGGTFYINQKDLTVENAQAVMRCIEADGLRAVSIVAQISDLGRAYRNDPAIFALAMAAAAKNPVVRAAALANLSVVCRIPTHLYHFVKYVRAFRGWGRGLRGAVSSWWNDKTVAQAAYHAVKYQSRDGYSSADTLRLSHPKNASADRAVLYAWMASSAKKNAEKIDAAHRAVLDSKDDSLSIVRGLLVAMESKDASPQVAAKIIRDYKLPREAIPTEWQNYAQVWEALLDDMPMTAMIRNLGNLSKCGLLTHGSDAAKKINSQLLDMDKLKKARIHPMQILLALRTYGQGHGMRGKGAWTPVASVIDALDDAFYLSFGTLEPTGKRWFVALDVSGSMGSSMNNAPLTCREAAAAMAMVAVRTESDVFVGAFETQFTPLMITKKQRLDDVVKKISRLPFGGTDCSLPMTYAAANKMKIDVFSTYTDSETWAGSIHPSQALVRYRQQSGIPAKSIVVGMLSNGFTIADPDDAGMLDCVGFDGSTPGVMAEFARG